MPVLSNNYETFIHCDQVVLTANVGKSVLLTGDVYSTFPYFVCSPLRPTALKTEVVCSSEKFSNKKSTLRYCPHD